MSNLIVGENSGYEDFFKALPKKGTPKETLAALEALKSQYEAIREPDALVAIKDDGTLSNPKTELKKRVVSGIKALVGTRTHIPIKIAIEGLKLKIKEQKAEVFRENQAQRSRGRDPISGTAFLIDEAKYVKILGPNNTSYTGETENGQPHGYGAMTYSTGETITGRWVSGELKEIALILTGDEEARPGDLPTPEYTYEPLTDGEGIKRYPDGSVYEGNFKGGQPSGQGIMRSRFGVSIGEFRDGKHALAKAR